MESSKISGGLSHLKYAHFCFPRLINTICPNCSKYSLIINENVPTEIECFLDISGYKLEWTYICNNCLKRKCLKWEETKDYELLFKINIRGEIIWAWNTSHLNFLITLFSGKKDTTSIWIYFESYINKKWFQKTKNKSDLKKLVELQNVRY